MEYEQYIDYEYNYEHIRPFYSICNQTFKELHIKLPSNRKFSIIKIITIGDRNKDQMATFGYVRSKWRECGINNHLFPPEYLIRIMYKYYLNEFVHFFDLHKGNHWRIDTLDIVKHFDD